MKNKCVILLGIISFLTVCLNGQSEGSHIQLSSGEKISGKVELKHPVFSTTYLMFNDTIKYSLNKIKSFQNGEGYFGRVADSETKIVKRTVEGRIDLFEETKSSWSGGNQISYNTPRGTQTFSTPNVFNTYTLSYFSKNGGDILDADYSNLKEALADNAESMRHLSIYQTLNYVQYGLVGSGLAIMIGGVATIKKERMNEGIITTGAIVAVLGWIPHLIKGTELQKAVNIYNLN